MTIFLFSFLCFFFVFLLFSNFFECLYFIFKKNFFFPCFICNFIFYFSFQDFRSSYCVVFNRVSYFCFCFFFYYFFYWLVFLLWRSKHIQDILAQWVVSCFKIKRSISINFPKTIHPALISYFVFVLWQK